MAINIYDFELQYTNVIEKVFKAYERHFNLSSKIDVDITCVDEDTIKAINKESRNVDSVTDVLSFPTINKIIFPFIKKDYKEFINPETNKVMIGEIIICINKVLEQALEYGHSNERELAYLTLHGLLHLTGYDHINEKDKDVMREKEEEILSEIDLKREV